MVLVKNWLVSSRKDLVSLTRGVQIFAKKMEIGEWIELVEATMGLLGVFDVFYGSWVKCKEQE